MICHNIFVMQTSIDRPWFQKIWRVIKTNFNIWLTSNCRKNIFSTHMDRSIKPMRRKPLPALETICDHAKRIVILENVMNPTNVGAIFRSAAALNMDAILLSKGCSDPLYRRSVRVSMGTVFQIPWTFLGDDTWPADGMHRLKELGYKNVAMALTDRSVSIDDEALMSEDKLAIILGTEGDGLCQETIDACDYTVKIPMAHGVDSLNVAAASAVAFWQLAKRK